ncbi:hypothetical protein GCM10027075_18530 [Streptomyces heilongjiangensis]
MARSREQRQADSRSDTALNPFSATPNGSAVPPTPEAPGAVEHHLLGKETHLADCIEDRWIKKKREPITGKRERTARHGKGYKVAGVPGVRDRWKPAPAEAGVIPPRVKGAKGRQGEAAPKDGFHVLWHTCASIMLEAGESVATPARWLGHSSPAVTLGYYAHFMPEAGSKGRTALDGLPGRAGDEHASRNSPDSPQG